MKTVTIIAIGLLICTSGFAAEKQTGTISQSETETSEVQPEENADQDEVREKKQAQWPRPYQPREEITADATVPFPVDI